MRFLVTCMYRAYLYGQEINEKRRLEELIVLYNDMSTTQ